VEIRKIMVVGTGQMGCGIAQVAAQAGYSVILYDMKKEFIDKGMKLIDHNLTRSVDKGRLSESQRIAALNCMQGASSLDHAQDADLVIEAVTENLAVKQDLFRELDGICPPHTLFATNTSSLSITEIAGATRRPEQVIGMHFMNPVPVMQLVELVRGLRTSDEVYMAIAKLAEQMGKTVVEARDFPGFVSNRILMPMINEAIYTVFEGVASPEGVDQVMRLGMNHPMGPLALADLIGLDTCLAIMETLHAGFGDSKYRPCPLLRNYVNAGWLGRKTGRGFYLYDS
jgi:3-hydroxybutyryl-CoA dehydrogenase